MNSATPPVTERYAGERKRLAIFSGLLFGMEIAGITIGESQSGFFNSFLTFDNPDSIGFVVATLIIWSLFRTITEWFNCDFRRRQTIFAKLDIYSAIFLSAFALAIFTYQNVTDKTLAEQLSLVTPLMFILGFFSAIIIGAAFQQASHFLFLGTGFCLLALLGSTVFCLFPIWSFFLMNQSNFYAFYAGAFIGIATRSALTSAFQTDTVTSTFRQRLLFLSESMLDEELENTIQQVSWRLHYVPDNPDRSKVIVFEPKGEISKGANANESSWRVRQGKLEILDQEGRVFSRFKFLRGSLMLKRVRSKDLMSLPGQYMTIEEG